MKKLIIDVLAKFDIGLTRKSKLDHFEANKKSITDIRFLKAVCEAHRSRCIDLLERSQAEFRQDLFVLSQLNFRESGYFVEFGATNGVDFSNTHLLEKEFGWTGILAEPARSWSTALEQNRTAKIDTRCVWKESGAKLAFREALVGELSTMEHLADKDRHSHARRFGGTTYDVETVSLNDLLKDHNAPREIDYLSLDTEGSELDILNAFDFSKYDIRLITCEHNFTENRERIHNLLVSKGYRRVFETLEIVDDWYIR